MRKNLAERQERMRKKLLDARQTFSSCAFREVCENPQIASGPEFCERCSPKTLQKLLKKAGRASL